MMRFGISTYAYTWAIGVPGYPVERPMTAFEFLDSCARLKADVVQIADNLPLHEMKAEDRNSIRKRAGELGLAIEVGARGMRRNHLLAYLKIAHEMDSPILRMVVDQDGYEPDIETIIEMAKEVLPELEGLGVSLAIENHDRFLIRDYLRMLAEINSPWMGICMDTVNSIGAGQGFETVVDGLASQTINLHVKDFRVRRVPSNMGFVVEGAPAGTGQLPIASAIRQVASHGKCQSAILENWPPLMKDMETTVKQESDWTNQGAAYLAGLLDRLRNEKSST